MNNIKGMAIASDGNMKRIAVTYDVVDDNGKIIKSNAKVNRVITDSQVLSTLNIIEDYVNKIVNSEEEN